GTRVSSVEGVPRAGAAAAARAGSRAAVGRVATAAGLDGRAAAVRGEGRIPLVERRGAAARAAQSLGPFAEPLQDLELVAAVPATILIERHLRVLLARILRQPAGGSDGYDDVLMAGAAASPA